MNDTLGTIEDRLRDILAGVNDWLKFAEAKNGALLAANLAAIFGITSKDFQDCYLGRLCSAYSIIPITLLVLSVLICLISFAPKVAIPSARHGGKPRDGANLIFYGDLARFEPLPYLEALAKASGQETAAFGGLAVAYATQAIINSRIALKKYRCFNWALWFTIAAILIPAFGFIVLFLRGLK